VWDRTSVPTPAPGAALPSYSWPTSASAEDARIAAIFGVCGYAG